MVLDYAHLTYYYDGATGNPTITYSNFWNTGFATPSGTGNISKDPLLADPANGDFHLKSVAGRWNPATETWVKDTLHSPCIDVGRPTDDFSNEPNPNGGRINMGAYGNTNEASKSIVPQVMGRHVFYNHCSFDGNKAAADADDDSAIAADKTPLLPGQTATFANYTSYSRGINGIMVDIAGLPGTPTTADFTFKVGNDNNPAAWANAPALSGVTVRNDAGVNGSDRITIIWPDNTIQKQWLQV
ncbi:MAG: hypothetical protein KAV00_04705, partial [Phycisphaerae bacterium]|nr:hypothetical protein [Phycisphaerae bacterium]